jgi:hypothetical protein
MEVTSRQKVRAAEVIVDQVEELARSAWRRLDRRRPINALGIYLERHEVELDLALAIRDLREAQAMLASAMTRWPSEADQDAC